MRNRKGGRFRDLGMTQERVADVARSDLLAAAVDEFAQATVERQESVGVEAPMSPVRNQPRRKAVWLRSGASRYPEMTVGPRTQISPCRPGATGSPSSPMIASVSGQGRPQVPGLLAPGGGQLAAICAASLDP